MAAVIVIFIGAVTIALIDAAMGVNYVQFGAGFYTTHQLVTMVVGAATMAAAVRRR